MKVPFELPRSVRYTRPSGAARDPAVQTGDVAVFREQDVAALATAVHAALRNRERVAGRVAADDERDAPDVALGGAAEALDAVGRLALRRCSSSKRMISCPMRNTSPNSSRHGSFGRSFM